ncbi:MAG: hypothetical protein IPJ77_05020 [Planctomycetes bacterium]|nr:hypothetical protein [Planctomycetota bacterium]
MGSVAQTSAACPVAVGSVAHGLAACPVAREPASARVDGSSPAPQIEARVPFAADVLFPDADTIVVADWDERAHVSLDRGATWETHPLRLWSRDMTVGANGVYWSLYFWRRMHGEASMATLAYSRNRGRVWTEVEWPVEVGHGVELAVPVDFLTPAGEEPIVLDDLGRCWRHESWGPESFASWKPIGESIPREAGARGFRFAVCGVASATNILVSAGGDVWLGTRGATTWTATHGPSAVALEAIPRAHDEEPERIAAATFDGELFVFDPSTNAWRRLGAVPLRNARVFGFATTTQGLWPCGEAAGKPIGGWMDFAGRWHALDGLPEHGQSNAIRAAPNDRVAIACGGVYVASADRTRWEHVWPK